MQILFSRTFQDSPLYSSTFQACANPDRLLSASAFEQFDQSSLGPLWVARVPMTFHTDSEGSGQTTWLCRLIQVFIEQTCQVVPFTVHQLK